MRGANPKEVLEQLISRAAALGDKDLNEAATRVQFVDEILRYVLGWPVESFDPEEHAVPLLANDHKQKQWLDYHLKARDVLRLVVEAKRIGKSFQLPENRKQREMVLANLAANNGPVLKDGIRQATGYCHSVGTNTFAVTNGLQWVASVSFAHHVPAKAIRAVVFYNLQDIYANLQDFVDLLSPDGIAAQRLMTRAARGGAPPPRFARRLLDTVRPIRRPPANYVARPLTVLMQTCFRDLTDEDSAEMLEHCYVADDATAAHIGQLEAFAAGNQPDYLQTAAKIDRKRINESTFSSGTPNRGESVLVVGHAGSGKSTFVAESQRQLAGKHSASGWIFLNVDLLGITQAHAKRFDHDRMVSEVCRDLLGQAQDNYGDLNPFEFTVLVEVFAREVQRHLSSLSPKKRETAEADGEIDRLVQAHLGDSASHLKAYLGWLKRKGFSVLIFLDNVDRGTAEFEQVSFALAQNLSRNTRATVVTTLRETTYRSGSLQGFLDASRHTALTIAAPPFVSVARRRFEYARKEINRDSRLANHFRQALEGTPARAAYDFAEILAELVLGDSYGVKQCIERLAGTNIRRALELLEVFATSPATEIEYWFRQHERGARGQDQDSLQVLERFLRSVMQGSHGRYVSGESRILNLFQVSTARLESHFLAVRTLQFLESLAVAGDKETDCPVRDMLARLADVGYPAPHVKARLDTLGQFGLVASFTQPEPPWKDDDLVRIGGAGQYYLHELAFNREYVDNVLEDTVVYDEGTHDALVHAHRTLRGGERHSTRRELFLVYLARAELAELADIGGLVPTWMLPVAEAGGIRIFGSEFSRTVRTGARRPRNPRPSTRRR